MQMKAIFLITIHAYKIYVILSEIIYKSIYFVWQNRMDIMFYFLRIFIHDVYPRIKEIGKHMATFPLRTSRRGTVYLPSHDVHPAF